MAVVLVMLAAFVFSQQSERTSDEVLNSRGIQYRRYRCVYCPQFNVMGRGMNIVYMKQIGNICVSNLIDIFYHSVVRVEVEQHIATSNNKPEK